MRRQIEIPKFGRDRRCRGFDHNASISPSVVVTLIESRIEQPALPNADREMPTPITVSRAAAGRTGLVMKAAKDGAMELAVIGKASGLHPHRTRVDIAKISQGCSERI